MSLINPINPSNTKQQKIKNRVEELNSRWYNRWLTRAFTKRVEATLKEGDRKPDP